MFGVLRPPAATERVAAPSDSSQTPPPLGSLAPMPSSDFDTRDELLMSAKDWAASQGYAIVIARSRLNRLWIKCDRGGTYENRRNITQEQRKRKRGDSRLLGCPFRMLATVKKDGRWRVETESAEHNHPPSEDLTSHPTLRRMTQSQLEKVHEMFEAGRTPADTVEELKKIWPSIKVLTRDVYNARKKYKMQRDDARFEMSTGLVEVQQDSRFVPSPDVSVIRSWQSKNGAGEGRESSEKSLEAGAEAHLAHERNLPLDPQIEDPNRHTPLHEAGCTTRSNP